MHGADETGRRLQTGVVSPCLPSLLGPVVRTSKERDGGGPQPASSSAVPRVLSSSPTWRAPMGARGSDPWSMGGLLQYNRARFSFIFSIQLGRRLLLISFPPFLISCSIGLFDHRLRSIIWIMMPEVPRLFGTRCSCSYTTVSSMHRSSGASRMHRLSGCTSNKGYMSSTSCFFASSSADLEKYDSTYIGFLCIYIYSYSNYPRIFPARHIRYITNFPRKKKVFGYYVYLKSSNKKVEFNLLYIQL